MHGGSGGGGGGAEEEGPVPPLSRGAVWLVVLFACLAMGMLVILGIGY